MLIGRTTRVVLVVGGRVALVVLGATVVDVVAMVATADTSQRGSLEPPHVARASAVTVITVYRRIALVALVMFTACSREAAEPPRTSTTSTSTTLATTTTTAARVTTRAVEAQCPVAESQLVRLSIEYWGFDGRQHTGALVVQKRVAAGVERIFAVLLHEKFPIRRMETIDVYGGDDEKSLDADNTSGYNCRRVVGGSGGWSRHAYGLAIDVNPIENPYLERGRVHPQAGREYLDRSNVRPGMAIEGGVLVKAFAAEGWEWGGRWTGTPDYQHFQIG
jgi:hypothetical protein